jgi:hypothetical protein
MCVQFILIRIYIIILFFVKAKEMPLQAWRDHEDSRRLRLPEFKIICT